MSCRACLGVLDESVHDESAPWGTRELLAESVCCRRSLRIKKKI